MKRFKSYFSNLCLLTLLILTATLQSCNNDNDPAIAPQVEHFGMATDTIVGKGASFTITPRLNTTDIASYAWSINGKVVSTEPTYTFNETVAGTYQIAFIATNETGTTQAQSTVNVRSYYGGFYVINEGQYGKQPGSVNYYDGKAWSYRIFQANNPDATLGFTSTTAVVKNNRIYLVSKDTPILVEADVNTFKQLSSIDGSSATTGQGNNFCAVTPQMGILTTGKGAFKVALDPLGIENQLSQATKACKDIAHAGNYVFVLMDNILVYNASNATYVKTIAKKATTGFARSKDGTLWAGMGNTLVKINPATLSVSEVKLPDGVEVNYNSTYTPSGMRASTTENALYFVKKDGWNSKEGYKYDIATNALTKIVTAPEGYSFYGSGLAVNPANEYLYATFTQDGWGDFYKNNKIVIVNPTTATTVDTIDYSGEFWFPSMIIF